MSHNAIRSKGSRREKRRRISIIPHRFIPFDITREILLRLPVRSLLCFRPVCKLWHSIIGDPYFVQSHLDCSLSTRLPSIVFAPLCGKGSAHIARLDANEHLSSLVAKPYFSNPGNFITVNGSCNGLICIVGNYGSNTKVLNPSTGEFLTAPPIRLSSCHPPNVSLGYHPVTKEYKLVHIFSDFKRVGCEVYTLGTSSWRKIAKLDYFSVYDRMVASANGFMYCQIDKGRGIGLLRFDLRDEVFIKTSTLNLEQFYGRGGYRICHGVVDIHGSIGVPVFRRSRTGNMREMDLWMLNDDEHSWTRKYYVIYPLGSHSVLNLPTPLLIHKDNILVHVVKRSGEETASLLQYHPLRRCDESQVKDRRRTNQNVQVFDNNIFSPVIHVESLVSLPKVQSQGVGPSIKTY